MADRYWVGGSGTWNNSSTANWATSSGGATGASVPTSSDNAIIDTNSGNGTITIASTAACLDCTINWTAVKTNTLTLSGNFSPSGNLNIQGNSAINRILIQSNTKGTARTITCNGTVTIDACDFRDITGAGSGSWDLSGATNYSGDCGGNSGITFTTAATQTYTGGTDSWSTAARWTSRVPLPQDDVLMSGVTGGTITADMPRLGKSIDWTGASGTPTCTTSVACELFGSITLISGMNSITGSNNVTLSGRGTHTITSAGKGFASSSSLIIDSIGGTYTFVDTFNSTSTGLNLSNGTLSNTGNYNITANSFVSNVTTTRTLTMGAATWTLSTSPTVWAVNFTNLTVSAASATIVFTSTNANNITFNGGGQTYGTLRRTAPGASRGTFTIQGSNTFGTLAVSNSSAATTLNITAGTTQTITGSMDGVRGESGKVLTLQSTSVGVPFTISKASGIVSVDYLTIKDSTASGGATFYAGANSTDGTGNTGWTFSAAPVTNSSIFGDEGMVY